MPASTLVAISLTALKRTFGSGSMSFSTASAPSSSRRTRLLIVMSSPFSSFSVPSASCCSSASASGSAVSASFWIAAILSSDSSAASCRTAAGSSAAWAARLRHSIRRAKKKWRIFGESRRWRNGAGAASSPRTSAMASAKGKPWNRHSGLAPGSSPGQAPESRSTPLDSRFCGNDDSVLQLRHSYLPSGSSFFLSLPAMKGDQGWALTGPLVFHTTLNWPSAFTSPMNTARCR